MSRFKVVLGTAWVGCALAVCGASLAPAATAATEGGAIQVWITPTPNGQGGGRVLITGAIGDYGVAQNANASGTLDPKGTYKKLVLESGTILIDTTRFIAATRNANPDSFNKSNCSAVTRVSGAVPIVSGTGAYTGISGALNLAAARATIFPKTSSGACNTNESATPASFYFTVSGTGTETYH